MQANILYLPLKHETHNHQITIGATKKGLLFCKTVPKPNIRLMIMLSKGGNTRVVNITTKDRTNFATSNPLKLNVAKPQLKLASTTPAHITCVRVNFFTIPLTIKLSNTFITQNI